MAPEKRQILFINAAHGFTHYCLLILPTAVLAMARRGGPFGAEYGPIVALATGMFVLYGLFSLPQGWLAQRLGRKALMAVFFLGTGAFHGGDGLRRDALDACGHAGRHRVVRRDLSPGRHRHAGGSGGRPSGPRDRRERRVRQYRRRPGAGGHGVPRATRRWRFAFVLPGAICALLGLLWLRTPFHDHATQRHARPFPPDSAALVRRAVVVLLLIAAVSGLVFNAFTLLLPKLMAERLASDARLLPMVGTAAFVATLCGAVTQFTVGRLIDRTTLKRVFLPMSLDSRAGPGALSFAHGWAVLPTAGLVAAVIFGQVTVNETMTARYISPAMRTRMYSVRFFVGFLGSAGSSPARRAYYTNAPAVSPP